jgi:predicted ATPase
MSPSFAFGLLITHIGYSEPMLEKVAFKNFLALRDVEVDLEPFTVIVGPNACGKSTLLEGIHRICRLKNGWIDQLVEGGDFVPGHSNPKYSIGQIQSSASEGNVVFDVQFLNDIASDIRLELSVSNKLLYLFTQIDDKPGVINSPISGYSEYFVERFQKFPNSIFLKLNGSRMSKASHSPELKPYLESDGAGLATFCENLQAEQPDTFAQIQESLKKVISSIRRFRIKRENIDWTGWINIPDSDKPKQSNIIGKKLVFDFENASDVPAEFVSEGTLISLALLAATAGATDNHIVLLDDIERGLHPRAIKDLISQLRALQQLNPGLQIVATTHSPYVLDYLEGHEIRVATHDPERGMLIAPLNKHPDFERWSEAMDPGQFWSHVGESWVAELQEKTAADD